MSTFSVLNLPEHSPVLPHGLIAALAQALKHLVVEGSLCIIFDLEHLLEVAESI